ncbi:MAG: hypothetical protein IJ223_03595 [Clostridia bacterium]|nr:hypothetical protein [Clostridia bacterium]
MMNNFFNTIKYLFTNTTFTTVLTGVLVYVISQFILELYINPRKKYKALKERIAYSIALYSCFYHNPYDLFNKENNAQAMELYSKASQEMRKMGAELAGYISTVPNFRKTKKEKLKKALGGIIGISNGFFNNSKNFNTIEANTKDEEIIKKNLDIK